MPIPMFVATSTGSSRAWCWMAMRSFAIGTRVPTTCRPMFVRPSRPCSCRSPCRVAGSCSAPGRGSISGSIGFGRTVAKSRFICLVNDRDALDSRLATEACWSGVRVPVVLRRWHRALRGDRDGDAYRAALHSLAARGRAGEWRLRTAGDGGPHLATDASCGRYRAVPADDRSHAMPHLHAGATRTVPDSAVGAVAAPADPACVAGTHRVVHLSRSAARQRVGRDRMTLRPNSFTQRPRGLTQLGMLPKQQALYGLTHVGDQMPPVGDL